MKFQVFGVSTPEETLREPVTDARGEDDEPVARSTRPL